MRVIPFKPTHAIELSLRSQNSHLKDFSREQLESLGCMRDAITVTLDNGYVIACGGIAQYWKDRGELWVVFDSEARKHFTEIHSIAKRFLSTRTVRRVEAAVDPDTFSFGARWVKALGFELEAPRLKAYLPDGKDQALFARVG